MKDVGDPESFDTFLEIMARLRGPEGCPWDREQTHASLKTYLLQECHEAMEAMDEDDPSRLADELGDILLQVGLHAQIGADDDRFTIRDVLRAINEKLVRRHPHVFGDVTVSGSAEVEANWERLKEEERGEKRSAMDGIPKSLPALTASQEVQTRAAKLGFDWPDMGGVLDKVREEISEFEAAKAPEDVEHELGDILAAIVNIGRKLGIDTEGALRKANDRFRSRFSYMETAAEQRGESFPDLPLDRQEELWQEAKQRERDNAKGKRSQK